MINNNKDINGINNNETKIEVIPTKAKLHSTEGIKVNIQNDKGNTALHYAIGNQFYSVADTLTRFGAREDIANNKGLLPWDCVENNLE